MAENVGSVEVTVDADTDPLVRDTKATAARLSRTVKVEIDVDLDKDPISNAAKSIERDMGKMAKSTNKSINPFKSLVNTVGNANLAFISLGRSMRSSTAGNLALAPAVLGLGNLIGGLAASVTALAGTLVHASASLVNMSLSVGAIAQGAIVAAVASMGLSDAFKAQAKAQKELADTGKVSAATQAELTRLMGNLTPTARNLVKAVQDVRGAWGGLQNTLQQNLFAGFNTQLKLLTKNLLPTLEDRLGKTATLLSQFGNGWAKSLSKAQNVDKVGKLMGGLNGILRALLQSIKPLSNALGTIFLAAMPGGKGFAKSLRDMLRNFNDFITKSSESGALTDFFTKAGQLAGKVVKILGNVGSTLFTIFKAGDKGGEGILDFFVDATQKMSKFFKSADGQDALAGFFAMIDTIGPTISNAMAIIGPVISGVMEAFKTLGPAIESVRTTLQPVFEEIGQALGDAFAKVGPLIGDLLVAIAPLAAAIGGVLAEVISQLADSIAFLLPIITFLVSALSSFLAPIIEKLTPLIAFLITLFIGGFGVVGKLGSAFKVLGPILGKVGTAISTMVKAWAKVGGVIGRVIGFVVKNVGRFAQFIANRMSAMRGPIGHVGDFFSAMLGIIKRVVSRVISAISSFVQKAGTKFDAFKTKAKNALDKVVGFFTGLGGRIAGALGAISSSVWDGMKSVLNTGINLINKAINGFNHLPGPDIPNIPALAKGAVIKGATLAIVGERGQEVVAPMNPRAPMAPGVLDAVNRIAAQRGSGVGGNHTWNVMLPTGDPQAAALAMMNRLAAAGIG